MDNNYISGSWMCTGECGGSGVNEYIPVILDVRAAHGFLRRRKLTVVNEKQVPARVVLPPGCPRVPSRWMCSCVFADWPFSVRLPVVVDTEMVGEFFPDEQETEDPAAETQSSTAGNSPGTANADPFPELESLILEPEPEAGRNNTEQVADSNRVAENTCSEKEKKPNVKSEVLSTVGDEPVQIEIEEELVIQEDSDLNREPAELVASPCERGQDEKPTVCQLEDERVHEDVNDSNGEPAELVASPCEREQDEKPTVIQLKDEHVHEEVDELYRVSAELVASPRVRDQDEKPTARNLEDERVYEDVDDDSNGVPTELVAAPCELEQDEKPTVRKLEDEHVHEEVDVLNRVSADLDAAPCVHENTTPCQLKDDDVHDYSNRVSAELDAAPCVGEQNEKPTAASLDESIFMEEETEIEQEIELDQAAVGSSKSSSEADSPSLEVADSKESLRSVLRTSEGNGDRRKSVQWSESLSTCHFFEKTSSEEPNDVLSSSQLSDEDEESAQGNLSISLPHEAESSGENEEIEEEEDSCGEEDGLQIADVDDDLDGQEEEEGDVCDSDDSMGDIKPASPRTDEVVQPVRPLFNDLFGEISSDEEGSSTPLAAPQTVLKAEDEAILEPEKKPSVLEKEEQPMEDNLMPPSPQIAEAEQVLPKEEDIDLLEEEGEEDEIQNDPMGLELMEGDFDEPVATQNLEEDEVLVAKKEEPIEGESSLDRAEADRGSLLSQKLPQLPTVGKSGCLVDLDDGAFDDLIASFDCTIVKTEKGRGKKKAANTELDVESLLSASHRKPDKHPLPIVPAEAAAPTLEGPLRVVGGIEADIGDVITKDRGSSDENASGVDGNEESIVPDVALKQGRRRRIRKSRDQKEEDARICDNLAKLGLEPIKVKSAFTPIPASGPLRDRVRRRQEMIKQLGAAHSKMMNGEPMPVWSEEDQKVANEQLAFLEKKKADLLEKRNEMLAKSANSNLPKCSNVVQAMAKRNHPTTVHGNLRGVMTSYPSVLNYLPPNVHPTQSALQEIPFGGSTRHSIVDPKVKRTTEKLNKMNNQPQKLDPKQSAIRLFLSKLNGGPAPQMNMKTPFDKEPSEVSTRKKANGSGDGMAAAPLFDALKPSTSTFDPAPAASLNSYLPDYFVPPPDLPVYQPEPEGQPDAVSEGLRFCADELFEEI